MAQIALVGWVIIIGVVIVLIGMGLSLVIGIVSISLSRKRSHNAYTNRHSSMDASAGDGVYTDQ